MEENLPIENSMIINREISDYLLETSRWGMFLAIIGYIGIGLLLIAAFAMSFISNVFSEMEAMPGYFGNMMGFIYVVMAVVYFIPVYFLHQFSRKMKYGILRADSDSVITGFKNLKSLFKFMGIITIIVMSLYLIILVSVGIFGSMFF